MATQFQIVQIFLHAFFVMRLISLPWMRTFFACLHVHKYIWPVLIFKFQFLQGDQPHEKHYLMLIVFKVLQCRKRSS